MRNLEDIVRNYGGVVAALNDGRLLGTLHSRNFNIWLLKNVTAGGGLFYENTEVFTLADYLTERDEIVSYCQKKMMEHYRDR